LLDVKGAGEKYLQRLKLLKISFIFQCYNRALIQPENTEEPNWQKTATQNNQTIPTACSLANQTPGPLL